ncbi:MAG: ADP-ribosylglycohydrolase family protein [Polyangiaceae bacterium]
MGLRRRSCLAARSGRRSGRRARRAGALRAGRRQPHRALLRRRRRGDPRARGAPLAHRPAPHAAQLAAAGPGLSRARRAEQRHRRAAARPGRLVRSAHPRLARLAGGVRVRRPHPPPLPGRRARAPRRRHLGHLRRTADRRFGDGADARAHAGRRRAFGEEAALEGYVAWYRSRPFDMGGTTRAALAPAAAAEPGARLAAARASADRDSQANGALMRASPLGIFAARRGPAVTAAARADAALTHPHPLCASASAVFVAAIAAAIGGADAEGAWRAAREEASRDEAPDVAEILEAARRGAPERFDVQQGWVRTALQNAFHRALTAATFEQGVVDTVMAGGDTDTNGAIAGALLGALHGREAVPPAWRRAVLACRPIAELGALQPRPMEFWPVDAMFLAERLLDDALPWAWPRGAARAGALASAADVCAVAGAAGAQRHRPVHRLPGAAHRRCDLGGAGAGRRRSRAGPPPRRRDRPARCRALGDALRGDRRHALLRPPTRDQPVRVVLEHTGGRRTEVELASLIHARALVDALGRAGRRATFVLRAAPTGASRAAFLGLVGAASLSTWLVLPVSGALPTLLILAPMAVFAALVWTGSAFSAFQPSLRLALGDDGFSVDTGTRQRFVSFGYVAGARALVHGTQARVEIMLRSGEVLAAVVERDAGTSVDAAGDAESRATAIARSIADATARWRCGPMAPVLPGLGRRGRAVTSWLASLGRVGSGADADHRRAAVPPESLWSILEDGASAPDARAGAAAALAVTLDEPGRSRLRLAAAATADLRLAHVFEAAAAGDDAEVAGALERIEDEQLAARDSCFS